MLPYPVPLLLSGKNSGGPLPEGSQLGGVPNWVIPHNNFIAPSRNKHAAARAAAAIAAGRSPSEHRKRESVANDDGWNWRKYGEKTVKGSTFPRSYYKCSYPGCPVKKIVEKDPKSGEVTMVDTKGEHNHVRPTTGQRMPAAYVGTAHAEDPGDQEGVEDDPIALAAASRRRTTSSSGGLLREGAAAALQLLGTVYTPAPSMLGPAIAATPASLLPIPPSLCVSTGMATQGLCPATVAIKDPAEMSEYEINERAFESGDDDDEWVPAEDSHHRVEPPGVISAALKAAEAVVSAQKRAAAMPATRRRAAPARFNRGRHDGDAQAEEEEDDEEDDEDDEDLWEEDEEVQVMKRMVLSNKLHRARRAIDPGSASPVNKRRRGLPVSPDFGVPAHGYATSIVSLASPKEEDRTVVELETDADNIEDGFRWRKYGQKVVKGNPHPRAYYKCTHPGCGVRKQVERSGRNPRMLTTTYEGMHNHPPPGSTLHRKSAASTQRRPSIQSEDFGVASPLSNGEAAPSNGEALPGAALKALLAYSAEAEEMVKTLPGDSEPLGIDTNSKIYNATNTGRGEQQHAHRERVQEDRTETAVA